MPSGLDPDGLDDALAGHARLLAGLLHAAAGGRLEQAEDELVAGKVERSAERRPFSVSLPADAAASRSSSSVTPGQKHLAVYSIARSVTERCPKVVPSRAPRAWYRRLGRTKLLDAMSSTRLEFRILGPLLVRVDGVEVPIGGPKQRALLALLLLSANRVVARDQLIGELFAEQSVNSADHALRNHVSRLRKVLEPGRDAESRGSSRALPATCCGSSRASSTWSISSAWSAEGREALAAGDPAAAAAVSLRASRRRCGTGGRSPISSSNRSRESRSNVWKSSLAAVRGASRSRARAGPPSRARLRAERFERASIRTASGFVRS